MIDWDRLNQLREDVGDEDFEIVVDMFFEETDPVVDSLSTTIAENRAEQDFHFLKGSASSIGFNHFANICSENERCAADGTINDGQVSDAIQSYTKTKALFRDELSVHVA